jgi:hypothetical protein
VLVGEIVGLGNLDRGINTAPIFTSSALIMLHQQSDSATQGVNFTNTFGTNADQIMIMIID